MHEEATRDQPIVIKKKKGHGGHHGGSWKVAYADFVTSMMAFFMVMWLLAQSDVVKESVAGYFQDPQGFKKGGNMSVLPGAGKSVLDFSSRTSMTEEEARRLREEQARKELRKAGAEIMKQLRSNPSFEQLRNQIEVQMTAEGLRISLLESSGESFFERGSAQLKPNTKALLQMVSQEIGKLSNRVIIEGHTDSYQYAVGADYTNWELSADRCNSARRFMKNHGLRPDQIAEVRGFADNQPKIASDPSDPRNRRIAIIVVNEFSGLNYPEKNVLIPEEELNDPAVQSGEAEIHIPSDDLPENFRAPHENIR